MLSIETPIARSEKVLPWTGDKKMSDIWSILTDENRVSLWLSLAMGNWWEAAAAIELESSEFEQEAAAWRDVNGNTVWHYIAALPDSWGARKFLNTYGVCWEKNKLGQMPMHYWKNLKWALVWLNLAEKIKWKSVWEKEHGDAHPIFTWAKNSNLDLATWGWANRPKAASKNCLTLWKNALKEMKHADASHWMSWGDAQ